jgi:uncharacterized protein YaiL (DUF2058 family)
MSLRDQLLAKGLVSHKQARISDQQSKRERKEAEGHQRRAHEVRAEEEARRKAEHEEDVRRKAEVRKANELRAEQEILGHRVRQIILANRLGGRGPIRYHHRRSGSALVGSVMVNERLAFSLRAGLAGIAELVDGASVSYVVVTRRAAEKLAEIAPETLMTWVQDTKGISTPEEAFEARMWESDLRARRVRGPE